MRHNASLNTTPHPHSADSVELRQEIRALRQRLDANVGRGELVPASETQIIEGMFEFVEEIDLRESPAKIVARKLDTTPDVKPLSENLFDEDKAAELSVQQASRAKQLNIQPLQGLSLSSQEKEPKKRGLLSKIGSISLKSTAQKVTVAVTSRLAGKLGQKEASSPEQKSGKSKKILIAAGAAAVAGFAVYAAYHGWFTPNGGGGKQEAAQNIADFIPRPRSESLPATPKAWPSPLLDVDASDAVNNTTDAVRHNLTGSHDFVEIPVQAGDTFQGDIAPEAFAHFGVEPNPDAMQKITNSANYYYQRDVSELQIGETISLSRLSIQMALRG